MPALFAGYGREYCLEFVSGVYTFRGDAIVPVADFFTDTVVLAHARSPLEPAPSHATLAVGRALRISADHTPLRDDMRRRLVVDAEVESLHVDGIRWICELPDLGALRRLVRLHVQDLDITTLPSLSPLHSLLELHLETLPNMDALPLTIGDAPRLRTLQLTALIHLVEIPARLLRRLAAKAEPLRVLGITRCGCDVPDAVGELVGLFSLHLADCMDHVQQRRLPNLSNLHELRTLSVKGFPHISVAAEQAPLTSLTALTWKDYRVYYAREDCPAITAFIAGSTSLTTLNIRRHGLKTLSSRLASLTALTALTLRGPRITRLGDEIAALRRLVTLKVVACPGLVHFSENILRECKHLRHLRLDVQNVWRTRVGWQLVACVPLMQDLETIGILTAPHHVNHVSEALVDAFRCWPPRRATTLEFDSAFCAYRDRDPDLADDAPRCPRDWGPLDLRGKSLHLRPVFRAWRQDHEQMVLAFVMGQHRRLGDGSSLASLDEAVMVIILAAMYALPGPEFAADWTRRIEREIAGSPVYTDAELL